MDGTRFWSDTVNHCIVPGCDTAQITVSGPLPVTVRDSDGTPLVNLPVYAFNGSTYVNVSAITDANGQVFLTLVDGNYRFQTEVNGIQFCDSNYKMSNLTTIKCPFWVFISSINNTF
ncbi:MAG: hypothetical protein CL609_08905 [Anaerolineaceae bacterium]|nr:hypothetical protein [Anaerolineaceae bacterium]